MLFKITFLTSLLFSAIYPLCFWISAKDPLKNNFHRFHLGLPCLVAWLVFIVSWSLPDHSVYATISLSIWVGALLVITSYYWEKPSVNPIATALLFAVGLFNIINVMSTWILDIPTPASVSMNILGGMIFCASLFAMNLGHWYLNVHGLPISHLKRAVYVFWTLTALRAAADIFLLFSQHVTLHGEVYPLVQFILTLEGFLLILAVLFGTIFPLICLYFVKGTLDVKSTQSATGILYAILCGVVIGDITYKYYFFKYGIVL